MNEATPGPERPRILIIDDDAEYAETLARALQRRGTATATANGFAAAADRLRTQPCAAVVLDLRLDGESGLDLIRPLLDLQPGLRILLLTGYASIATAVEAIKLGAIHYLPKPVSADAVLGALGYVPDTTPTPRAGGETDSGGLLTVDRLEWEHIQQVLAAHGGNISATARALKMHRRTLQRKLGKRPPPSEAK